ncbi:MAG: hypothetical protein CXT78_07445 [Thaumarchaeota archaeon]|nr:MAG: hypothetical protein CXT78_07445 [Nitrososphaerota archaeon]
MVSTDNKKIAQIGEKLGSEISIRPKKLSDSGSPTIDTIKFTLNNLKIKQNYIPDKIIILQPTSPLRSIKTINDSIKKLTKNISSIISVSKITKHPFKSFWMKERCLIPFEKKHEIKFYQRQKLPALYYENGSIYTFWNKTISRFDSIYGPKIKPMLIEKEHEAIDINTDFDFFIAEMILTNWRKINNLK